MNLTAHEAAKAWKAICSMKHLKKSFYFLVSDGPGIGVIILLLVLTLFTSCAHPTASAVPTKHIVSNSLGLVEQWRWKVYAINLERSIVGFDANSGQEVGTIDTARSDGLIAGYFLIAASDKYVAAYFGDSQELIVFERTG